MNEKTRSRRRLFGRADAVFVLALLAAALAFFYMRPSPDTASECRVVLDGAEVRTVQLDRNQTFTIPERPNVVFAVKDGAIAFQSSDCPDKVCVHTGFIKAAGQSAACLPNGIILKIVPVGEVGADEADVVAQ